LNPKKPSPVVKPGVAVETYNPKKEAEELKKVIRKMVAKTDRGANATRYATVVVVVVVEIVLLAFPASLLTAYTECAQAFYQMSSFIFVWSGL